MTNIVLERYFAGDDLDIERDVTDVDVLDPVVKAWFTIKGKKSDPDPGALQKIITTSLVPDVGQITEDGSELQGNGVATVIFQLTKANTLALGSTIRYLWDIQVMSASGRLYTPTEGTIRFKPQVTLATS